MQEKTLRAWEQDAGSMTMNKSDQDNHRIKEYYRVSKKGELVAESRLYRMRCLKLIHETMRLREALRTLSEMPGGNPAFMASLAREVLDSD